MKLSIFLGVKSCFATTTQFLNFVPYENAQCCGSPSGIGFGAITDQCLTFDHATNWLFQITENSSIKLTPYIYKGGESCEVPKNSGFTYNVGDCIAATELSLQNSLSPPFPEVKWFYKLQIHLLHHTCIQNVN